MRLIQTGESSRQPRCLDDVRGKSRTYCSPSVTRTCSRRYSLHSAIARRASMHTAGLPLIVQAVGLAAVFDKTASTARVSSPPVREKRLFVR